MQFSIVSLDSFIDGWSWETWFGVVKVRLAVLKIEDGVGAQVEGGAGGGATVGPDRGAVGLSGGSVE